MTDQVEKSPEPKSEKHLTREQRRRMEIVSRKAKEVHELLCERFTDFMGSQELSNEVIENKRLEIVAQWKTYCRTKNLNKEAFDLVGNYLNEVIRYYNDMKAEQKQPEAVAQ